MIEDRGDGTTGLRYAHTGTFGPEDFEAQNDQIQQHTDFYLHTLGEYVAHFSGRPVTYIGEVPGGIAGTGELGGARRLHAAAVGPRAPRRRQRGRRGRTCGPRAPRR